MAERKIGFGPGFSEGFKAGMHGIGQEAGGAVAKGIKEGIQAWGQMGSDAVPGLGKNRKPIPGTQRPPNFRILPPDEPTPPARPSLLGRLINAGIGLAKLEAQKKRPGKMTPPQILPSNQSGEDL